jgi:hypothetical protein
LKNREQGTGNRKQGTGNREQGTGNREQETGNREQGTGNREQGIGNSTPAKPRPCRTLTISEVLRHPIKEKSRRMA